METTIINEAPETALQMLSMFPVTKDDVNLFAAKIINDVHDGNANPLKVKLMCKSLEAIVKKIDEGTKEPQKTEAAKYGEKPFEYMGAELHLTSVHTEINYDACEDVVYKRLTDLKANLDKQIKERQEFLKAIKQPQTLVDDATGEVFTCKPVNRKQTEGVKVTLK